MIKIYLPLLGLLLFASCGPPRLITKGVPVNTPDYIVKTDGKQVDVTHIKSLNEATVTVNTHTGKADTTYSLANLSGIKMDDGYLGVQDGKTYTGVYYGRLILLKRFAGISYDMNTHRSHATYRYYLQKQGQPEIVDLNNSNLIDYVQDNPLALRKAKSARIFTDITFASCITAIGGLSCVFLPYSNHLRKPAVTAGLFALPTFLITLPIASHKRYKTIFVYNQ